MRLIIASRKSDLARIQAQNVARLLKESNNELEIIHEYTSSFGDQNPDIPLWQMPEKGAFTEDFREKLESGKVDMVVHSWKDLPTELSPTSMIFTVKRADPRDLILFKRTVCQKQQLKIMTSSPRRQFHLPRFIQEFFPAKIDTVESIPVRGNIPTRLSKFMKEDVDGIIVAKAAIDRILETTTEEYAQIRKNIKETINQCLWMIPPLSHFPTAPAQGALAIEVNRDNSAVTSLLDKIHHQQTYDHVKKERDILRSYGGGCHQKIGVTSYPTTEGNYFSMSGQSPEGDLLSELAFKREEKNITWPRPDSENDLFPVRPSSELFFTRKSLELEKIPPGNLFISRYHDDPVFKKLKPDQLIWTAGTSTWKKLASNGIWCQGCNEGLGESFENSMTLINGEEPHWIYLTHQDSPVPVGKLAYYKLTPKEDLPDLTNKKYFFWMSGSQFQLALKQYPSIKNAFHACGPGKTYDEIKKHLSEDKIKLFLNHTNWLEALGIKTKESENE